ncbi:DUF6944 family repetitive protein [Gottfriedia acidiceleris]|uniref:Uncharacterized protein n=1 Tax=Gottfriedia acidiceleris TaxID=371036 RepID=A0ABY4JQT5_9BACI|nr:hypothetical protein [Gottfriedia acidiceleris]UPM56188.1 hypothetical protein MY490_10285 [Gottfriedia acidiceleris]
MRDLVDDLPLIGAYFLLFGTTTAAVGISSKKIVSENFGRSLFAKGNAIEAFGNSIQAIGREKLYKRAKIENENEIEKEFELTMMIGAWLQAIGNGTNTFATNLEIEGLEREGFRLNAIGGVIQSIGAQIETIGALMEGTQLDKIEAYGNQLIGLGALIDGIANAALLRDKMILGEDLLLVGSWVQVFGAILIIYALRNKRSEYEREQLEYRYGYYPNKQFEW